MKKSRSVTRNTAKFKLELFVTKVYGWKPLTFFTKSSFLDFAVVPDMSLKGTLLIIRASSSKIYFKSYRTPWKICLLFIFRMFVVILRLFSLSVFPAILSWISLFESPVCSLSHREYLSPEMIKRVLRYLNSKKKKGCETKIPSTGPLKRFRSPGVFRIIVALQRCYAFSYSLLSKQSYKMEWRLTRRGNSPNKRILLFKKIRVKPVKQVVWKSNPKLPNHIRKKLGHIKASWGKKKKKKELVRKYCK